MDKLKDWIADYGPYVLLSAAAIIFAALFINAVANRSATAGKTQQYSRGGLTTLTTEIEGRCYDVFITDNDVFAVRVKED